jgi:hypothetical protein
VHKEGAGMASNGVLVGAFQLACTYGFCP